MARGVNKVILVGNLGNDPEVKYTQSGMAVTTLSLATTSVRKDKDGNQQERTEWHRIAVFVDGLIDIGEKYLRKGSKVLVQGKLENRKWTDQQGVERYSTEVALRPFQSNLVLLDAPNGNGRSESGAQRARQTAGAGAGGQDDDIPF